MDEDLGLLVIESGEEQEPSGLARVRAIRAVEQAGGKVRHDSGGRLLLVERAGLDEEALREAAPGARLEPADAERPAPDRELDANDTLFLQAVRVRASRGYQEMKRRQVPGESPEEQLMFSAPCTGEG
jgi:hypothetical protein